MTATRNFSANTDKFAYAQAFTRTSAGRSTGRRSTTRRHTADALRRWAHRSSR